MLIAQGYGMFIDIAGQDWQVTFFINIVQQRRLLRLHVVITIEQIVPGKTLHSHIDYFFERVQVGNGKLHFLQDINLHLITERRILKHADDVIAVLF